MNPTPTQGRGHKLAMILFKIKNFQIIEQIAEF
jgi:hypothetical protein